MNISIAAEPVIKIGELVVTNSLIVAMVAMAVLTTASMWLTRSLKSVPGRVQAMTEVVIEFLLNMITGVTGDKAQTRQFFPLIATIFFFVLTVNWLGLLPGVGTVGLWSQHHGETVLVPLFRSTAADLNFTIVLGVISVIAAQVVGIGALGFAKYSKKFVDVGALVRHPLKQALPTAIGLLELVLEVMKVISFAFRLFGNVFAGEVLLTIIMFLVPYLVPMPFLVLELFVGLIQAVVFSMLTLVFMKMATIEAHH